MADQLGLPHFDIGGKFGAAQLGPERVQLREGRVPRLAFGSSARHLSNRPRFITAAVIRWARCVFACPKYGVRRSRDERTPCAIVPSTPARRAYSAAKSAVCSRARPTRSASCWASGRIVIARRAEIERVHCGRSGQVRQSTTANLILITGVVPRASAGV